MSAPAEVRRLLTEYEKAARDSLKAAERRRELGGLGASRARVTTANARWATLAEHRDRVRASLDAECAAHGLNADLLLFDREQAARHMVAR